MKHNIDQIIAKAWLEGKNPMEVLKNEGVNIPADFKIPPKPTFDLGISISRNAIDHSDSHMNSSYCYCG